MTDQINKMNFISGDTFEGKTFNPSEINFVDVTDDILPALNVSERFTPRYGLEFSTSVNTNTNGGVYSQNGVIGSTTIKKYSITNASAYYSGSILHRINRNGDIDLTELSDYAYAIIPFSPQDGDVIYQYTETNTFNYSFVYIGKRTSDTTFAPYFYLPKGATCYGLDRTADNLALILNEYSISGTAIGYRFFQFDMTNKLIRYSNTSSTPISISTWTNNSATIDVGDLYSRIAECDCILYLPQNGSAVTSVFKVGAQINTYSTYGDLANAITSYSTPVTVEKKVYLDNINNYIQPDNDTIVVENQKLTSTCQKAFDVATPIVMTPNTISGLDGITLGEVLVDDFDREMYRPSAVSGTKFNPSISATTVTIPTQNADGNLELEDSGYRYVIFPLDLTKDAFSAYYSGSYPNGRAYLGKLQNDGTFRLLFVFGSDYIYQATTINNDGTSVFTQVQNVNKTSKCLYYLDVTNKLLYRKSGTDALTRSSVTDELITDLLECNAVMYSPDTTNTPPIGVLANIGYNNSFVTDIKTTSLVPYNATLERPILSISDATTTVKGISRPDGSTIGIANGVISVDTTWLTQFIQDTFGINPQ